MSRPSKIAIKNILIVTESFTRGGLETHIEGEIRQLIEHGWRVHFATGHYEGSLDKSKIASFTDNLVIKADTSVRDFKKSVERIMRIIDNNRISLVHVHPFMLAAAPAVVASKKKHIPCVVTLHGPGGLHNEFYHPFINFLHLIALSETSEIVMVSSEIKKVINQFGLPNHNLKVLPNAIGKCDRVWLEGSAKNNHWLICSRIDELKVVGIKEFIKQAVANNVRVDVVGDGASLAELQNWIDESNFDGVQCLGHVDHPQSIMVNYSGVAGMGRVVLEAISCGCPTCLVGYDGVKTLIGDVDTFNKAAEANFSGRNLDNMSDRQLKAMFESSLLINSAELLKKVITTYSEAVVWNKFIKICYQLHTRPKSILVNFFDNLEDSDEVLYRSRKAFELIEREISLSGDSIEGIGKSLLDKNGAAVLRYMIETDDFAKPSEKLLVADYNLISGELDQLRKSHETILASKTFKLSQKIAKAINHLRLK